MEMVPVLLILSLIIFALLRLLPGDPVVAFIGQEESGQLTAEQRTAIRHQLGVDRPLPVQYATWLRDIVTGDWGRSNISRQPVSLLIKQRLGATVQLALAAWVVALAVGIPIGVLSALRRNSWLDVGITVGALTGIAIPNFLLGLLLMIVFGVYLGLLPVSGFVSFTDDPIDALRHLALPTIALATGLMASIIRQTRSAMLETLNEDYIRTAHAKGLSSTSVIVRHALKNAMLPIVTIAGLQIGNLASGTIIIETVFSIPGMGRLIINAVINQDYGTVQTLVVILAVFTITANLAADIMYGYLDPRIKLA